MQETLARAMTHYQAGDLKAALGALDAVPATALSLTGVALEANIHAKRGEALEAGEAFLRAASLEGADRKLFLKLAANMFVAAGASERLVEDGAAMIEAAGRDPELARIILPVLAGNGKSLEAAPFVPLLDPADPNQAMLGINILRSEKLNWALAAFADEALRYRPDDGLFNAERFTVAQDLADFDVQEDCLVKIRDPASVAGANMFAAQGLHRRLMWSDDEALNAQPGLDHFLLRQTLTAEPLPRRRISPPGERIRIAYLSNDFYSHATMILLQQVLMEHDLDRIDFRLFCYSPAERVMEQGNWPEKLKQRIEPVRDLDDLAAAQAISHWGADILVDLKGFTGGARLGIVTLSDAPLKVTYLGYPGSVTGVGLDYTITDRIVTPDTSKPFYDEKLCRLPECYQSNDSSSRPLPGPASRAEHGLPEYAFVFASFNIVFKLNRETVRVWANILKKTPGSVFWCFLPDEMARTNLLKAFDAEGVAPERILFAGYAPYSDHISRIALADLALDTFPCNGHTTTSDTLWAGVPVLAIQGNSFASRVSASLLHAVGLPELIVDHADEFVDLAVSLSQNPERLAMLRARLVENRAISPLFDSERFARHLEAAYERIAARARSGLEPEHVDIEALPPRATPFH